MLNSKSIRLMGSLIEIKINHLKSEQLLDKCIDLLHSYNKKFSANDDNSFLMEINNNSGLSPIKVDSEVFELIKIGRQNSLNNNFNLNIAIGPLIKAWKIGFENPRVLKDFEIKKLLQLTNPYNIILDEKNQTVFLKEKGMEIDLGALAKGYIADRIINFLKNQNVESALINLGGNVLTLGNGIHNKDGNWKVGIQNPNLPRGNHVKLLKANDISVVTSGVYVRNFTENNRFYHHIINPKTGYPIESDMISLTIISKKSVDCEIWTTKLFGKSKDFVLNTVNSIPEIDCFVIDKNDNYYHSDGFEKYLI